MRATVGLTWAGWIPSELLPVFFTSRQAWGERPTVSSGRSKRTMGGGSTGSCAFAFRERAEPWGFRLGMNLREPLRYRLAKPLLFSRLLLKGIDRVSADTAFRVLLFHDLP